MATAGGDFTTLSNTVAARDASLPVADLLGKLRSPGLHAWQPPGGGAAGALSHAVIHSLDVTVALDRPPVAPAEAATAVLEQLTAAGGAWFGVDLTDVRLEATDTDWSWGSGQARPRRQRTSGGTAERPNTARRPDASPRLTHPVRTRSRLGRRTEVCNVLTGADPTTAHRLLVSLPRGRCRVAFRSYAGGRAAGD